MVRGLANLRVFLIIVLLGLHSLGGCSRDNCKDEKDDPSFTIFSVEPSSDEIPFAVNTTAAIQVKKFKPSGGEGETKCTETETISEDVTGEDIPVQIIACHFDADLTNFFTYKIDAKVGEDVDIPERDAQHVVAAVVADGFNGKIPRAKVLLRGTVSVDQCDQ